MGLKGRFCHQGDEYLLAQVKTSNLKVLTGSSIGLSTLDTGNLFPEAYSSEGALVEQRKSAGGLIALTVACLTLPVFFFGALYFLYRFVLGTVSENLLAGF
jgi:type VI secretion system protein ImpK